MQHEMTISQVLLAWEDAMAYLVLTNGSGEASETATESRSGTATTIGSTEMERLGLAVVREGNRKDLPPHIRDFVDEVIGGPKT